MIFTCRHKSIFFQYYYVGLLLSLQHLIGYFVTISTWIISLSKSFFLCRCHNLILPTDRQFMYIFCMDVESLLHSSYLCHDLDVDELEAVASIAVIRTLSKGELLFLQGDTATGFYVLLNGRIRLYKSSIDGREYTLHQIKPGQMFAEVAIFRGRRYPANCIAREETTVAFFPKDEFLHLLKKSPELALKIIASLSSFLRDFNHQLEELSLKEVPGRIASFILSEAENSGHDTITLETSKIELANRLGTISETLSRNLRKLQDNNIISVDRDKITIRNKTRLGEIADGEKI